VNDDVKAAAIARFAAAISGCAEGWRERWERPPTAKELVHPFEICLVSSVENLVSDPDDATAILFPARPAPEEPERKRLRPTDFEVTFHGPDPDEKKLEGAAVTLTGGKYPSLEVLLEHAGDLITVDVSNRGGLTPSEIRSVVTARLVPRFVTLRNLKGVKRVLLRPLEGLADPEEVSLSGGA
jgi:hypothetical protein